MLRERLEIDLRFGAKSETTSPIQGAFKNHTSFAPEILEIRTQGHTSAATDAQLSAMNILQQFIGSVQGHEFNPLESGSQSP